MSYYDEDPSYTRPEKTALYNWLRNDQKFSILNSRRYMLALKGLETFAKKRNLSSKKLFTFNRDEVFVTVAELYADEEFSNYLALCKYYPVKPLEAIEKVVVYAADNLESFDEDDDEPEGSLWEEGNILYVHKGLLSCQRNRHNLITATAVMDGFDEQKLQMTVKYCKDCNKFFISEVSYAYYRKKYGALIGNIQLEHSNAKYRGEFLAEESPLHLCGYNVNQQDNYTTAERRFIISKIIDKGIMNKAGVINYLEYFISHNGQQSKNSLALSKWEDDLQFTRRYERKKDPIVPIIAILPLNQK